MSGPDSELDAWVGRRFNWMTFALLALIAVLGVGIVIAVAVRLDPVDGLWIGCWLGIAGYSIAQIVAPGPMIEWRARMMAGGPANMQRLGQTFGKGFGIGTSPDQRSKRNMRIVAFLSLLGGTVVVALMWLAFHVIGVG